MATEHDTAEAYTRMMQLEAELHGNPLRSAAIVTGCMGLAALLLLWVI